MRGIKLIDTEFGAVGVAGHIDEQVAEETVNEPGRAFAGRDLAEGDFHFVERIHAGFVNAWILAGGADEDAGKHI